MKQQTSIFSARGASATAASGALALAGLLGVSTPSVAAEAEKPAVREAAEAVDTEKAGMQEQVALEVKGMYCAVCERKADRALKKVPGVREAKVNLKEGRADVLYDPAQAKVEDLIEAIEGAGFQASPPEPEEG
jgi:P-type Cu+ transporter